MQGVEAGPKRARLCSNGLAGAEMRCRSVSGLHGPKVAAAVHLESGSAAWDQLEYREGVIDREGEVRGDREPDCPVSLSQVVWSCRPIAAPPHYCRAYRDGDRLCGIDDGLAFIEATLFPPHQEKERVVVILE